MWHFQITWLLFCAKLARKAILFHKPQLFVGLVAAKRRPRLHTESVCNFPSVFHVTLLNIVMLQLFLHLKMLLPGFWRLLCGFVWFEAFCCARYPEWRLLYLLWHSYCWENSEECAEKGMTQNSKHNHFLSAPADECWFLLFHAPIFPWQLQLSKSSLGVCVCMSAGAGRGLLRVFSFLAPSWPMRSWWSLSPLALQRWSSLSTAAHSQMHQECWWWWAMVCGHVLCPCDKEKQEGHAYWCLKYGFGSYGLSA